MAGRYGFAIEEGGQIIIGDGKTGRLVKFLLQMSPILTRKART
jgi:hypothetical protein